MPNNASMKDYKFLDKIGFLKNDLILGKILAQLVGS